MDMPTILVRVVTK